MNSRDVIIEFVAGCQKKWKGRRQAAGMTVGVQAVAADHDSFMVLERHFKSQQ